ncbi:hypothetical protein VF14_03355 [Nostoc linckia z18]|uniref:Uncharacterized protein n=2 Tax=Nostoc linckia TaxID=92942 RepID=A0A9Q5ZGP7_NOSLI|nr:hypothetical protein [Nostoc linckia]PHK42412.1 hypothetical protein VF12_03370 [Nostoc linckia z15]PHK46920.1 hypothetical protein VF13_07995 [Nostoc linckia z16]PHJ69182.1 hypothetical protein VF02_00825 [Nostoc linckia z1]PHJ73333.1 hypothetical protein VF05_01840 [Nostoc linckia z3]PHJ78680.1 hypothetical protein VF03_00825 [Nostoc linckia z2]
MFGKSYGYSDEEVLDLGACCGCETSEVKVTNILTIGKKTLLPGTGWGCMVCQLPLDGAIAVVCDGCLAQLEQGQEVLIKYAVYGDASNKQRCDINDLTEEFGHKDIPHG